MTFRSPGPHSPMVHRPKPRNPARTGHAGPARALAALRAAFAIMAVLLTVLGTTPFSAAAQQAASASPEATVYVIPIRGEIEPGVGNFLERSLGDAEEAGATTVVLDISTPGGRLDTVLEMRDAILDSPLRTIAFVNREAFSAGALITIASDEIWMTPGAVFGAATPVNGGTGETADAKVVSAVRSTFRATAEEHGRDPVVAEAMVDPAVTVDGLDSPTTLLTLTTTQAGERDYLDGIADDRADLLADLGFGASSVTVTSLSPIEHLVRWLTNPLVASLLVMLGLFLIIADGLFGGFGFVAVAGVISLGLFFGGHSLAGLAGWEDLLLVGLGLGLIALEIAVIPGFGLAGISGLVALAAGLFLTMTGRGVGELQLTDELVRTAWLVVLAIGGAVVGVIGAMTLIPRLIGVSPGPLGRSGLGRLALSATVDERVDERPVNRPSWLVRSLRGDQVLEDDDRPHPGPSDRWQRRER
ncbi:MAG: Putative membrane-bound ClpP-class protease associated with aq_911 [uncultured Thermomicrobiales bacterium]|uniref:Membrane-bound ClpP-class protease associated with aq_911 n=1 Tax=uncultured Thermomicrobiales bacterium TaxID=1645740 RepID=A0A6J4VCB8_9BACT|nr:MAG: Putative membrane-bound ClpP-class protease associated with aq_911 [uncultured Thermomicrobiales bacterium]